MLTDTWVIAQCLVLLISWLFLAYLLPFIAQVLRYWDSNQNTEKQLYLEQKSYLVATILQFLLAFQFLQLWLFLATINTHLTQVIKGAMCATGVLGTNAWGYPTLYLKIGSILLYALFLMLNFLDNNEPAYPLSPQKYYVIIPAFVLLSIDLYATFHFFANIAPDVIATCCSVKYVVPSQEAIFVLGQPNATMLNIALILWLVLGAILLIGIVLKQTKGYFLAINTFFILLSVYVLQHFFVKYIYGLPSHNCLFDIFWAKYYYVGYVLFGLYFASWLLNLFNYLLNRCKAYLRHDYQLLSLQIRYANAIVILLIMLIPIVYWAFWKGNLV